MKISGGLEEQGIVIGNTYDKYGSKNPVVRWIMAGFDSSLNKLVMQVDPKTLHEVGCGEGYWVMHWNDQGIEARGSDFSGQVIEIARENSKSWELPNEIFKSCSLYDVESGLDSADLIVCCEVMEHLEYPEEGLRALQKIVKKHVILSVPREPIWCILNMFRGKYLSKLGNTPGHIQHWSSSGFVSLVAQYFDIIEVSSPFPWTMVLCRVKDNEGGS